MNGLPPCLQMARACLEVHTDPTLRCHCRCALLVAILTGAILSQPGAAKDFLGIDLGPTPSEFPTRSFRDDTTAAIAGM